MTPRPAPRLSMASSGTVAFLFTDIEGSTKKWEQDRAAMSAALQQHDMLLRQAIEGCGGQVFKTIGDAFCAVFGSTLAAVEAAVAAQCALADTNWAAIDPDLPVITARMAVHSGTAEARDDDFFGPHVIRTSRLLSAGHGGQVLLTAAAAELVRDDLPPDLSLRDMGEHRLKDLLHPVRIYQLAAPGLADTFPPLSTLDERPNNLPQQPSRFIGRQADLAGLADLVGAGRLVTLTGVGGTGKTRLALQLAAEIGAEFTDGIWLIALAALAEPQLVAGTIAATLGLREESGRSAESILLDHLQRRRTLLILDNCEHLLDACAGIAHSLLQRCAGLALVATSRQQLGITGEHVWHVGPLEPPAAAAPDAVAAVRQSDAGQLFVERAEAAAPGFALGPAEAQAVIEICRRLDGIPLAIELAAARSKVLALAEIARRLDDRFRLLAGGARTALPHQQTLRGAMDWSHDLLGEGERALFRRLAVFRGGWTLEAAESVLPGDGLDDWEVLDLLGQLIDHSLVEVAVGADHRYWLLETVRAYADEQLTASGEGPTILARHAQYFHDLTISAEPQLLGPAQADWLARLEREHDNLRRALAWAVETDATDFGLEMAAALWRFWYQRGHLQTGRERLLAALAIPGDGRPNAHRAQALHGAGTLAFYQGDLTSAQQDLESALDLWRELADEAGQARTLNNLALVASEQGDYVQARRLVENGLAAWRRLDDLPMMAILTNNLALMVLIQGELGQAEVLLAESLALNRRLGNQAGVADAEFHMGVLAQQRGRSREAQARYAECLAIREALGDRQGQSAVLRNQAELATDEGDFATAIALLEQCLVIDSALGDSRGAAEVRQQLGVVDYLRGRLAEAAELLDAALAEQKHIGHKRGESDSLDALSRLACRQGQLDLAAERLGRSLLLRRDMGHWLGLVSSVESCALLAAARGDAAAARRFAGVAAAERQRVGAPLPPSRAAELSAGLASVSPEPDEAATPPLPDLTAAVAEALASLGESRASRSPA